MVFYGVRLKKAERSPERQDEVQTAMLRTPLCPQCCWREAGSCRHGDTAPPALTALTHFPSPLRSAAASEGSQGPLCPPVLLQPQESACSRAMPPCRAMTLHPCPFVPQVQLGCPALLSAPAWAAPLLHHLPQPARLRSSMQDLQDLVLGPWAPSPDTCSPRTLQHPPPTSSPRQELQERLGLQKH